MRRILLAGLIVFLFTVRGYSEEREPAASDALVELNSSFIAAHVTANKLDLASGGPIVLLRSGKLVLVRGKTETVAPVVLPEYETLKTFAHLPAAIYLMLGPPGAGRLDAQRLEQLSGYLAKIEGVEKRIDQFGLKGTDLDRQKSIIAASKQFIAKVIQQQRYETQALYAFTRRMVPMIKANIAGAAASQLDAMHRQMMAWKKELTAEEWKKLRVVVRGAVLARKDNLAKQYFQRLLHLEGEGVRLVYMEGYYPPTPMLTLLATRSVDQGVSIAVFDNPERMFRDVLADAARAHIKTMKFE